MLFKLSEPGKLSNLGSIKEIQITLYYMDTVSSIQAIVRLTPMPHKETDRVNPIQIEAKKSMRPWQ